MKVCQLLKIIIIIIFLISQEVFYFEKQESNYEKWGFRVCFDSGLLLKNKFNIGLWLGYGS